MKPKSVWILWFDQGALRGPEAADVIFRLLRCFCVKRLTDAPILHLLASFCADLQSHQWHNLHEQAGKWEDEEPRWVEPLHPAAANWGGWNRIISLTATQVVN